MSDTNDVENEIDTMKQQLKDLKKQLNDIKRVYVKEDDEKAKLFDEQVERVLTAKNKQNPKYIAGTRAIRDNFPKEMLDDVKKIHVDYGVLIQYDDYSIFRYLRGNNTSWNYVKIQELINDLIKIKKQNENNETPRLSIENIDNDEETKYNSTPQTDLKPISNLMLFRKPLTKDSIRTKNNTNSNTGSRLSNKQEEDEEEDIDFLIDSIEDIDIAKDNKNKQTLQLIDRLARLDKAGKLSDDQRDSLYELIEDLQSY